MSQISYSAKINSKELTSFFDEEDAEEE